MKIMLDAGHYGNYNRSPAYPEYWESYMSWKLCELLAAELEDYGIEVGVTRTDQTKDMEVYCRGKCAKGYDVFISLHSNAVGRAVNENVDHPIVFRLASDTDLGERLARKLTDMIAELMGTKEAGRVGTRLQSNGSEYYGVLRGAKAVGCPHAFIIEHSFHTASAPAKWLTDERYLAELAGEEAKIIAETFGIDGKEKDMKEVEALRREIDALKKRIDELASGKKKVYHYYSELPAWAREPITKMHKAGVFVGAGPSDMALPENLMRTLVILHSAGVLKV